jgi:hypothetical protein
MLPDLTSLRSQIVGLTPDVVSIAFEPDSSIPVAAPCLDDALHVTSEARYALYEAFAHLDWYRRHDPKAPNERAAIFFARFYTTAAASCLYAAAEDVANAIIGMFEIDRRKVDLESGKRTSLHSKVGPYLLKYMQTEEISRAVAALGQSDAWARTMNWRNNWVHCQSLVQGLGIVYSRKKRWNTFGGVCGGEGFVLDIGGGDEPEYSIDDVVGFVRAALSDFVRTFGLVTTCYLGILSKAGITHRSDP